MVVFVAAVVVVTAVVVTAVVVTDVAVVPALVAAVVVVAVVFVTAVVDVVAVAVGTPTQTLSLQKYLGKLPKSFFNADCFRSTLKKYFIAV